MDNGVVRVGTRRTLVSLLPPSGEQPYFVGAHVFTCLSAHGYAGAHYLCVCMWFTSTCVPVPVHVCVCSTLVSEDLLLAWS